MRSKRWLLWGGIASVGMGVALILVALLTMSRPATVPETPTAVETAAAVVPSPSPSPPPPTPTSTPPPTDTPTPDPLIPTPTPVRLMRTPVDVEDEWPVRVSPTPTPVIIAPPTVSGTATAPTVAPATVPPSPVGTAPPSPVAPTATPATAPLPGAVDVDAIWRGRYRWGIGVAGGSLANYDIAPLRLGWYLNWGISPSPGGLMYGQMVRMYNGALRQDLGTITAVAEANPGALWLIGNEPDVRWQDSTTPGAYAAVYHQVHTAIKAVDPTAVIAIGGISQPTPLRMRYLDAVLASYRQQFGTEMPIDAWNIHNFILREERGSWGVDIPPGMADNQGILYEIEDSGNLDHFRQQIVAFRRWMADRGYQNYPLIVSEYGIPMPVDYGFPADRVGRFLTGTFDYFLSAADPALGYPADNYRLVQLWCWYSLSDANYNGHLFDPATGGMTAVGAAWAAYVGGR